MEKGKSILTPKASKAAVDSELLLSLADVGARRLHGPFDSLEAMLRSLKLKPVPAKNTKTKRQAR